MRSRARHRRLLCVACLAALSACATEVRPATVRVMATPVPTPTPEPTPSPTPVPTPAPTARATRAPRPVKRAPALAPRVAGDVAAFTGLGTWVDVFDFTDDPSTLLPALPEMAANGVRTVYLETARFNSEADIINPRTVALALEEAHRLGMRVVAWYPPQLIDVDHDLRRSLAAVRYVSPNGHRFDGFGADIERTDVPDVALRNARLVDYSRRLREGAGSYALAAIPIAPSSLEYNPKRWPDFPWATIAPLYDVFMPMSYWTFRGADPQTAASLTAENMRKTASLTGRPVHIIGGVGDRADLAQTAAYVEAALQGGTIGGGMYDYRTTKPELWDTLRALNR